MFLFFVALLVVNSVSQDFPEKGFYFVNLVKDDLVLFKIEPSTHEIETLCNYGPRPAYKTHEDYKTVNSGSGLISYYKPSKEHEYTFYVHTDPDDIHKGDYLKCDVEESEVEFWKKVNVSCEGSDSHGQTVMFCSDTMGETNTTFYQIRSDEIIEEYEIPFISNGDGTTQCEEDGEERGWYCQLYGDDGKRYFMNIDLGSHFPKYYLYDIKDIKRLVSFNLVDYNTILALVQKEDDTYAFGEIYPKSTSLKHWLFKEYGQGEILKNAKETYTSFFRGCSYLRVAFMKVIDKDGNLVLLKYEWDTGKETVVDTSSIGDLTFASQPFCM